MTLATWSRFLSGIKIKPAMPQQPQQLIESNPVTTHIGTFGSYCSDRRLPALASTSTMPLDSMIGCRNDQRP